MIDIIERALRGYQHANNAKTFVKMLASTFLISFTMHQLLKLIFAGDWKRNKRVIEEKLSDLSLELYHGCILLGGSYATGVFFGMWKFDWNSFFLAILAASLTFLYYFVIALSTHAYYVKRKRFHLA
ncbi:hypothetical protein A3740_20380 [Oleiphilus sp. HI0068]|nr:hypothetical protein A3740_20380 [Oleiphilus sp. HI0068]KZY75825.1 hypothetical protein A3741_01650 [Oleiphilus sp. HI0069]KZZ46976.1 hypothetical protein A3755_17245 [Oleiphilus sp. HI0085]